MSGDMWNFFGDEEKAEFSTAALELQKKSDVVCAHAALNVILVAANSGALPDLKRLVELAAAAAAKAEGLAAVFTEERNVRRS